MLGFRKIVTGGRNTGAHVDVGDDGKVIRGRCPDNLNAWGGDAIGITDKSRLRLTHRLIADTPKEWRGGLFWF